MENKRYTTSLMNIIRKIWKFFGYRIDVWNESQNQEKRIRNEYGSIENFESHNH